MGIYWIIWYIHESLVARQRRTDIEILWPQLKARADSLEHARRAFTMHALSDSAWLRLDRDELYKRIDLLE
jgi:hypothetical protein